MGMWEAEIQSLKREVLSLTKERDHWKAIANGGGAVAQFRPVPLRTVADISGHPSRDDARDARMAALEERLDRLLQVLSTPAPPPEASLTNLAAD